MDILKDKSDEQLLKTILGEVAKSTNELKCANSDINKANGRIGFILVLLNEMINRQKD